MATFPSEKLIVDIVEPRALEPRGTLRPITSNSTGRYDNAALVEPSHVQIATGQFLYSREPEPSYLPPQWSAHIHPEGQLYFYREAPLRVVTEAYIYRPDVMAKITYWTACVEGTLCERKIPISDQVELFLKLEDEDCAYYFVDHASRAQFWMEPLDSESLDLPPVMSQTHLKTVLEELYWTHVEHFPMHLGGLSLKDVDALFCVFSHATADHLTSRLSTFPYSQGECHKFMDILKQCRDYVTDGHSTCVIARLWSLVCHHRYVTHYGQEHARLSRTQAILHGTSENPYVSAVVSRLSFKASEAYLAQLNDLFVDRLLYVDQWRPFVSGCLHDWRRAGYMACSTLMLHLAFVFLPTHPIVVIASVFLFSASLVSSVLLVHRHENLENAPASQAIAYLEAIHSPKLQFHHVALVYSLPKTLYLWGLIAFFANCMVVVAKNLGLHFAGGLCVLVMFLIVVLQRITSTSEMTFSARAWLRSWYSKEDNCMV